MLSACETALGDQRAALGLAGIAIKSGARSALGSLWKIDDEATSILVQAFYSELRASDVTKAEALRRAQQSLIETDKFDHPSYWAPFLLVSNWL